MSAHPDTALYLARLERRQPFSERARQAFLALPAQRQCVAADHDFVREGDRPIYSSYLKEGFVSRYKTLRDGSRQIVGFHVPGDMVDLQSALVIVADHGIYSHIACTLIAFAHDDLLDIAEAFPEVGRAFWFDTLSDAAVFREWTFNVGRRSAPKATAHLLLEMHYRFAAIGMSDGESFELPVTQADLADALGISAVHVNRSLQSLRAERLIRTFRKTVTIENMARMIDFAEFDPAYLHPEGPRQVRAARDHRLFNGVRPELRPTASGI